jgi:hypothetical protein
MLAQFKVHKVPQVLKDQEVLKVWKAQQAPKVNKVQRVKLALREHKGFQVLMAQ